MSVNIYLRISKYQVCSVEVEKRSGSECNWFIIIDRIEMKKSQIILIIANIAMWWWQWNELIRIQWKCGGRIIRCHTIGIVNDDGIVHFQAKVSSLWLYDLCAFYMVFSLPILSGFLLLCGNMNISRVVAGCFCVLWLTQVENSAR